MPYQYDYSKNQQGKPVTEELLTVREVAELLGVSKHQVYRRIIRGDLAAAESRRGNVHYLVRRVDLEAYLQAGGADVLTSPRNDDEQMMRVSQVAATTGFAVETIRRMCYDGRLPYIKGNGPKGHLRIPRYAVDEMMDH